MAVEDQALGCRIYILAQNYDEAKHFAASNQLHPEQWVFLSNVFDLIGVHKPIVIRTGLWYEGGVAYEIDKWLKARWPASKRGGPEET